MIKNIQQEPLEKQFKHLLALIDSPKFLHKQGLGSEIPFFICPFNPKKYTSIIDLKTKLINQLKQKGIEILEINLYELSIAILKQRDALDELLNIEINHTKAEIKELLQGILDPEKNLVPEIGKKINSTSYDVLFISGVGEVYPFIRSHNILNNLQTIAKDKPTIMFFPGDYTQSQDYGSSLDLFGILHDDKYYRAFNIFHCEAN